MTANARPCDLDTLGVGAGGSCLSRPPQPPEGPAVGTGGWGAPGLCLRRSLQATSPLSGFCLPSACAPPLRAPSSPPPGSILCSLPPGPLSRLQAFPLLSGPGQTLPLALGPSCGPPSPALGRRPPRGCRAGPFSRPAPALVRRQTYHREACRRGRAVTRRAPGLRSSLVLS